MLNEYKILQKRLEKKIKVKIEPENLIIEYIVFERLTTTTNICCCVYYLLCKRMNEEI